MTENKTSLNVIDIHLYNKIITTHIFKDSGNNILRKTIYYILYYHTTT